MNRGRAGARTKRASGLRTATALVAALLFWNATVQAGEVNPPGDVTPPGQRQETFRRLKQAEAQHQVVLTELLGLQLDIGRLQRHLEELQAAGQVLEQERRALERDLATLEVKRARLMEVLGRRLRLLQEKGRVGYLEVVLQATSFQDFLTRFEAVRTLVTWDLQLLEENYRIVTKIGQEREDLARNQRQLADLANETRSRRRSLAALAREKEQRLTELAGERQRYEAELTSLDQAWAKSYPALRSFFQALARIGEDLPAVGARVEIQWIPFAATITLADASLNDYLASRDAGPFRVSFAPEGVIIESTGPATALRVVVRPEPDGEAIRLVPRSVTLDGIPVEPEVWHNVLGGAEVRLQARDLPAGVAVRQISLEAGRLVLVVGSGP